MNRKITFFVLTSFWCFIAFSQDIISGKVLSKDLTEPLEGVSVYISNTTIGAVTDVSGNFEFALKLFIYSN